MGRGKELARMAWFQDFLFHYLKTIFVPQKTNISFVHHPRFSPLPPIFRRSSSEVSPIHRITGRPRDSRFRRAATPSSCSPGSARASTWRPWRGGRASAGAWKLLKMGMVGGFMNHKSIEIHRNPINPIKEKRKKPIKVAICMSKMTKRCFFS